MQRRMNQDFKLPSHRKCTESLAALANFAWNFSWVRYWEKLIDSNSDSRMEHKYTFHKIHTRFWVRQNFATFWSAWWRLWWPVDPGMTSANLYEVQSHHGCHTAWRNEVILKYNNSQGLGPTLSLSHLEFSIHYLFCIVARIIYWYPEMWLFFVWVTSSYFSGSFGEGLARTIFWDQIPAV